MGHVGNFFQNPEFPNPGLPGISEILMCCRIAGPGAPAGGPILACVLVLASRKADPGMAKF